MFYLTIAFSLWMLIDAIRRNAPGYWILIVLFAFPPFGALVYFFSIKIHDYRPQFERWWTPRALSIEELMARYEGTPSQANQLALATAFYDAKRFDQAASLYSEVLDKHPGSAPALWGLARVRRSQGELGDSVRFYERVLEADPRHGDFAAALEYAETLWEDARQQRSLEVLEDIAQETRRLNHQLAFAHYVALAGDRERARSVLGRALRDYDNGPAWLQQKDRRWAAAAGELLKKLDAS